MNGPEPPCASETVTGGDVAALDGVRGVAATAMQPCAYVVGEREDCGHGFHIRLVMVSSDHLGCYLRARQGLTKKGFCTGPVAFVA